MMNFGEKPPIFGQFLEDPPMFMENLPKKGPLSREFWAQKPTHMGGTYPYPRHVMYPPGSIPPKRLLSQSTKGKKVRLRLVHSFTLFQQIHYTFAPLEKFCFGDRSNPRVKIALFSWYNGQGELQPRIK